MKKMTEFYILLVSSGFKNITSWAELWGISSCNRPLFSVVANVSAMLPSIMIIKLIWPMLEFVTLIIKY